MKRGRRQITTEKKNEEDRRERWRGRKDIVVRRERSRKEEEQEEESWVGREGRRHKFRASVKRALRGEALAPPICQYPEEIRGGTWPEG